MNAAIFTSARRRVNMAAELLPDELWEEVERLLPPPPPRTSKGGRPPVCNKAALKGIIFLLRSGVPWQMLPTEAFHVSGSSCWRRFTEWTAGGIWPNARCFCTLFPHVCGAVSGHGRCFWTRGAVSGHAGRCFWGAVSGHARLRDRSPVSGHARLR